MSEGRDARTDTRTSDARTGDSCLILGYDRTESARTAATWAARQLPPDGKLVIVHAGRPQHAPPSPLSTPLERHEAAQAVIDELLMEESGSLFDIDLESEVSDRDPVSALIDAAERHDAQAIVVGHERHTRLHRALGTVTSGLLGASPVPVVTVPLTASASEPVGARTERVA